ncbi:MAG TPA: choice-of-anchor I family protein [Vicinamibacterales bacterium]|nr:choice-of-anchor I family protein [Vicinamibacterales bacterium]
MGRQSRWLTAGAVVVAGVLLSSPGVKGDPPPKGIVLSPLGVYTTGLFDEGAVEISAYDAATQRAFLTFAEKPRVEIVDLSDPSAPQKFAAIDLTPWGGAGAHSTSVAVRDGVLAVAVPQGGDDSGPGKVLFFTTAGAFLQELTVGALPDMLTFTPNGRFLLTANEGQPNQAYTVDPEGSVSVIDMSHGAGNLNQADVATADFRAFNDAALDPSIRIFGPRATVAQDLEPEYIAVSHDSRTAWVTLQENNAIGIIDLTSAAVTRLVGLGFKDHSRAGSGLDGSRDDRVIGIRPWPLRGMYLPDAIAAIEAHGRTYLVTANEGDVREYDGLNAAGEESIEIEDAVLDPIKFPNFAVLQHRTQGIGRLKVTRFGGDTNGDGKLDELRTFGARSFSIWSDAGTQVFDSGDELEQRTAAAFPQFFNASNTNNTMDDRSDDKGPEPEGVTVARLFGRTFIFVMLERIGGVMVYEATEPASPRFVQYISTRNFAQAPAAGAGGDLGPEAARIVQAEDSPTGAPLLIVSNEVSGSLRIFSIAPQK